MLGPAEERQASTGGSNPRLSEVFERSGSDVTLSPSAVATCAVISDRSDVLDAVAAALDARGVRCTPVLVVGGRWTTGPDSQGPVDGRSFDSTARLLARASEAGDAPDAVVVALGGGAPVDGSATRWEAVLAEHEGLVEAIHGDAAQARSVADASATSGRPMRLVTLVDARTAGGRSRAQAATQLSRAARRATGDRVSAFVVGVEAGDLAAAPIGELAAHLVCSPDAPALSGAELVAGDGWCGLRSHPRPTGSVSFDGPEVPPWFDDVLHQVVGADVDGDGGRS